MFGLTASTWNVVGIILGLAGVLLLFRLECPVGLKLAASR